MNTDLDPAIAAAVRRWDDEPPPPLSQKQPPHPWEIPAIGGESPTADSTVGQEP